MLNGACEKNLSRHFDRKNDELLHGLNGVFEIDDKIRRPCRYGEGLFAAIDGKIHHVGLTIPVKL
jgi:hypothetical protein